MKRRLLSMLLALVMVLSLPAFAAAAEPSYTDTAGHWAESSIERWSGHGIVQGSDGAFDPDGQLTCAQLAAILARLLKLPEAPDAGFTDNTADAWYYDSINRCAAAGILLGNGDGTVTPEGPISRERAMVMLARVLGVEPIENPDLTKFGDAAEVSDYAQGYVAALIEAGIVNGVGDDRIGPQLDISRAATVAILDRAIGTYADKDGETVEVGDGLTLIVAKDVKIENAPAGSTILVADGADVLTVNGVSVTDDQTYVVPEKKPEPPVHTHSYDEYNYCAGCGQFKSTVVAAVGQKGYETLTKAVAAAQDGDTVKLTANITLDERVETSFSGTIDLNGRTLTSTETCKNGSVFHVASGTLTIKNGSMIGVAGPTGWTDELYEKECDAITVAGGATVTLEDLSISICSRTGACVYVFDGGKAYITSGTYSNDTTEFDANGTTKAMLLNQADSKPQAIFVSGGTFKGENPANGDNSHNPPTFLAAGYVAKETSDGSGIWTVTEDTSKTYTVQVGNGKYETLTEAVAAAGGQTITLLKDISSERINLENTDVTIDLNGKTLTSSAAYGVMFCAKNGHKIKIIGTTEGSKLDGTLMVTAYTDGHIEIDGGTYENARYCPLYINGAVSSENSTLSVKNAVIRAADGTSDQDMGLGVYLAGYSTSTFTNCTITAPVTGIEIRAGKLTLTNCTVTGGSAEITEEANGNGATVKNAALAISQHNTKKPIDVTVAGGTYTATAALYQTDVQNTGSNDVTAKITDGTFRGTVQEKTQNVLSISGGTFSSDPTPYLAAGYKADGADGSWTVREMTWDEYPVDGSVLPSGLVIEEFPQESFDSNNGKTGTITIKDKDALLYFAYRLDPSAAYTRCSEAHGTGWGHTCVWYSGSYARHVVLAADIDLEGMELSNGFGNFASFDFDGQNHKISNVTIKSDGNVNTGLFAGNNRSIKNLVVENVTVVNTSGSENCVGIVSSDANAKIENVTVKNSSVTGGKYTGAIVGYNYGDVINCTVEDCTVSGQYKVGGIVGYICNSPKTDDADSRSITGNTLTNVTVKAENVLSGRTAIVGKIVGNWNAVTGSCSGNNFSGTTDATENIGQTENGCNVQQ